MRYLGIDFGERRIGLALSDPGGDWALPLTTLTRSSDRQAIQRISEIAIEEGIESLVVGEPRNLDGTRGAAAERAASFARKLQDQTGLPCHLVDESLTTVEAQERLRQAGVDPQRHRERVDAVAAQILLQQFLDSLAGQGDE